jgi:hypothetical protein
MICYERFSYFGAVLYRRFGKVDRTHLQKDKRSKGMPGTSGLFHMFLVFFLDSLKLEDESEGCPETSVKNYYSSLRSIPGAEG